MAIPYVSPTLVSFALRRSQAYDRLADALETALDNPGGHLRRLDRHLSPRALHLILKNPIAGANRAAEAIKPLTWHDFRRTVISDIIADSKQGGLVEAQKIAGHS